MTERVLIIRHASGLVNRARRMAIEKWPLAKLEVHDLSAYGKPPSDFRWDRYAHLLIDDEYLRREGLLWLSELGVPAHGLTALHDVEDDVRVRIHHLHRHDRTSNGDDFLVVATRVTVMRPKRASSGS